MKIVVIGLGSMGKRRIRLLKRLYPEKEIIGIDTSEERLRQVKQDYDINVCSSIDELGASGIKYAFVCTSPLSHADIINQCLKHRWHVFTEINLVDDRYEENIKLAEDNNLKLFISSTPMYRKEIKWIKNKVNNVSENISYMYHVGQYLPDWHPWESYNNFFINNKKTNGCRELFAIELPWIFDIFGEAIDFKVIKNKITKLNIDYDDIYSVIFKHKTGHIGVITVDVVSRKAVRNLEIFGENIHVFWEGTPDTLYNFDIDNKQKQFVNLYQKVEHDSKYADNIIEDAYKEEIINFFYVVENKAKPCYTFSKDINILKIIDRIEK